MTTELIVFSILAVIITGFSLLAVTTQRIIRSAVYLLFVLLATAGVYLLLGYQFLAATQVIVYGGGVMVLFIFSIFLTHDPGKVIEFEKPKRMVISGLIALAGLGICGHVIYHNVNKLFRFVPQNLDMKEIGMTLMGTGKYQYMLPFEAISLLLLACIIGALMIARKK